MKKLALHWQILIALLAAVAAGTLSGKDASLLGITFYSVYDFIGTMFLNALKMIIVPLVLSSIITGIAGLGNHSGLGRLGAKTITFYALSSFLAIMVGLVLVNLTQPGIINGEAAAQQLNLNTDSQQMAAVLEKVEDKGAGDITDVFLRMVPTNVIAAAANGQLLGLIFFGLLFGFFMTRIDNELKVLSIKFWQAVFDTMMLITLWVMKFAPYGVFGLVAKTVAATGFAAFQPLLIFFFTALAALAIHAFITLPLLLHFVGRIKVGKFMNKMSVRCPAVALPRSRETLRSNLLSDFLRREPKVDMKTLLLGALDSDDDRTRYQAAKNLPYSYISDRDIQRALLRMIASQSPSRGAAASRLIDYHLEIEGGAETMEKLLFDSRVGRYAIGYLIAHGKPRLERQIDRLLSEGSLGNRRRVAGYWLHEKGAAGLAKVGPLLTALSDKSLVTRAGSTMDLRAVPHLLQALKSSELRKTAQSMLETIRFYHEQKSQWTKLMEGSGFQAASAAEALIQQFNKSDNQTVKLAAIASLGTLAEPETLPFLVKLIGDLDPAIRKAATAAVEKINAAPAKKK